MATNLDDSVASDIIKDHQKGSPGIIKTIKKDSAKRDVGHVVFDPSAPPWLKNKKEEDKDPDVWDPPTPDAKRDRRQRPPP